MAKQVSKTVIGGFVISAIVMLVAGVMIFGGGQFFKKTLKFGMFFQGSVKGLKVGSPVVFRGVEIGLVDSVVIHADAEKLKVDIPVVVEIELDRFHTTGELPKNLYERAKVLVERGLKAQLLMESMVTGQLMIELDFHPDKPIRLVGKEMGYPEIPTIPSTFQELAQRLKKVPIEEISEKLLFAIKGIEKLLSAPELMDTVRNLKEATQNANQLILSTDKMINDADTLVLNVNQQVNPLTKNLGAAVDDARKLLQNADGQIQPVSDKLQDALVSARRALDQAQQTLVTIDSFAGERSAFRHKLDVSLEEIAAASRSVRALTDYLERHPEALLQGKPGS